MVDAVFDADADADADVVFDVGAVVGGCGGIVDWGGGGNADTPSTLCQRSNDGLPSK